MSYRHTSIAVKKSKFKGVGEDGSLHLLWNALRVDDLLKHVDHIVELTMDITDDDHWLLDAKHV